MKPASLSLSQLSEEDVLTVAQASAWASERTGRNVTPSNISYLIKYGRIPPVNGRKALMVRISDLERYYQDQFDRRKAAYKSSQDAGLNWRLSFEEYKEAETTKHVHRLHPYKGKFIPQLVEYFLDSHIDAFKNEVCFEPGDIVLDPFCGSGTTLVQANELGINAVGIDVSLFNTMISNLKLSQIPLDILGNEALRIENRIKYNDTSRRARAFEDELLEKLKWFNKANFPSPDFRRSVRRGEIDEKLYSEEKEAEFRYIFFRLLNQYGVDNNIDAEGKGFIGNWYLPSVRSEIDEALRYIDEVSDISVQDMLRLILSRTVRSSRATTHRNLATLIHPVTESYYCAKHSKICKPLFTMFRWWRRYRADAVKRKAQFEKLRTDTKQICLTGDSREIDIHSALAETESKLAEIVRTRGIRGIFSSPPYLGMIDYHEQHAYAYELFGLPRSDDAEIGPMSSGRGRVARESYIEGISDVLINCMKYMVKDCDVFLVANDRVGIYPRIAAIAGMYIHKEYRRPVLNRAEGDKSAYSESIFHLKRL